MNTSNIKSYARKARKDFISAITKQADKYVISDGGMAPYDCLMGWAVGKTKEFSFLGERSFTRPDTARTDRKQLAGLKPKDPTVVIPEGAQIVMDPNQPIPMDMMGHVTSSYWSECLGHYTTTQRIPMPLTPAY